MLYRIAQLLNPVLFTALTAPLPYTSSKSRNAVSTKHADLPRTVLFDMTNEATAEIASPEPADKQVPTLEEASHTDPSEAKDTAARNSMEDAELNHPVTVGIIPPAIAENDLHNYTIPASTGEGSHCGQAASDTVDSSSLLEISTLDGKVLSRSDCMSPPLGMPLERSSSSVSKTANWGSPVTAAVHNFAPVLDVPCASASKAADEEMFNECKGVQAPNFGIAKANGGSATILLIKAVFDSEAPVPL